MSAGFCPLPSTPSGDFGYITGYIYRPERLGALLVKVEEKSRQFGNVYVSVSLYTARRRNAPVLPGQVLVVDDCPADLPCSFSVKTSPHKCHAYFVLDQPASSDELSELAKRAAYARAAPGAAGRRERRVHCVWRNTPRGWHLP